MRIALLADIHGNAIALNSALTDIQQRGGVDGYWVLGDLCAIGYDPIGVLEALDKLPNLTVIRGNADRYAFSLDLPPPTIEDATQNPKLIPILMEVAGNFHWTRGALEASGWIDWLQALPFDHRTQLPDGTGVYLVHSCPQTDEGKGLNPSLTDAELADMLEGIDAGLIAVGHFHQPMHRHWDNRQIINPGSVSNTFHHAGYAFYAIVTAETRGFDITFYRVPYDLDEVIRQTRQTHNIGNDYNIFALSGQSIPSWQKVWDGVTHLPPIITS